jgi:DNA-binding CsgD family transcriptional regulator
MILAQSRSSHSVVSTLERPEPQDRQPNNTLLQGVIESFLGGILILTERGEFIQSNDLARQVCKQLTPNEASLNPVPKEIWFVCQALIESRAWSPARPIVIESEITLENSTTLRIRVQWFKLDAIPEPCLLVILEDQYQSIYQSIQELAIAEVDRYGLTPREAEVWLHRRANCSYKEIAAELQISINTVKKHVKNIRAKQKAVN